MKAEMVYCDAEGCEASERLTSAHNWIAVQGMGHSGIQRHYCNDHVPQPIKSHFHIWTTAEHEQVMAQVAGTTSGRRDVCAADGHRFYADVTHGGTVIHRLCGRCGAAVEPD